MIDDVSSIDFPTSFEHGHGTLMMYIGRLKNGLDKKF